MSAPSPGPAAGDRNVPPAVELTRRITTAIQDTADRAPALVEAGVARNPVIEHLGAVAMMEALRAGWMPPRAPLAPEALAQRFHEAYERLAPSYDYRTREASAKPWDEVPENNRALMTAVCAELLAMRPVPVAVPVLDEAAIERAAGAARRTFIAQMRDGERISDPMLAEDRPREVERWSAVARAVLSAASGPVEPETEERRDDV